MYASCYPRHFQSYQCLVWWDYNYSRKGRHPHQGRSNHVVCVIFVVSDIPIKHVILQLTVVYIFSLSCYYVCMCAHSHYYVLCLSPLAQPPLHWNVRMHVRTCHVSLEHCGAPGPCLHAALGCCSMQNCSAAQLSLSPSLSLTLPVFIVDSTSLSISCVG